MKIWTKILPAVMLAVGTLASTEEPHNSNSIDIFSYFKKQESWTMNADAFVMENRKYGFRFLDAERTTVFSPEKGKMSFGKFYVYETRVYWKDNAIRRVEVSVYNKGDANEFITKEKFETSVQELGKFLNSELGMYSKAPDEKPSPRKIIKRVHWNRNNPMAQLEWAFVEAHTEKEIGMRIPYSPEYIRVLLIPKTGKDAVDNANLTGKSMLIKAKNLRQLKENIVRNTKGDVMIENVPMVDQGQKGYCAAASAERILRYFGIDIDQHQVAQLAETSARSGTSIENITDAITTIGKNYSLDQKNLISADRGKYFQESQTFKDLKDYNAAAKRAHKPQINWEDYTVNHTISISDIWNDMDPDLLMQSRLKHNQDFTKFLTNIKTYVDNGIPLFWSCLVGMYPEVPDINSNGKAFGHMRLIIGYNTKTHEIIYSDSWGADHAIKRMPEKQAWAMTKGLLVLKPRM